MDREIAPGFRRGILAGTRSAVPDCPILGEEQGRSAVAPRIGVAWLVIPAVGGAKPGGTFPDHAALPPNRSVGHSGNPRSVANRPATGIEPTGFPGAKASLRGLAKR